MLFDLCLKSNKIGELLKHKIVFSQCVLGLVN